jgi:EAL domain-containing protein (putative c-di-GMP-specific phosphodiesterase class I)
MTPPRAYTIRPIRSAAPAGAADVMAALHEHGIEPGLLQIEVTETVATRDPVLTGQVLGTLRQKGIKILIDDFGAGYSSLVRLRTLPVDAIKIDRLFIKKVGP